MNLAKGHSRPAPPAGGFPIPMHRDEKPWLTVLPAGLSLLIWGAALFLNETAAALTWIQRDGYRVAELDVLPAPAPGFTLLPAQQTGLLFTNLLSDKSALANQNLLNGSGLALGDYDGDGHCDMYFCCLEGPNELYRNLGGWKFQKVTRASLAACPDQASRGAAFADINGDRFLDLIVTSIVGPNACLLNDGQGRFKNVTQAAGLVLNKAGCESLSLADVDGDGDLDLYITNNGDNSILRSGGTITFRMRNGKPVVSGRQAERLQIIGELLIEKGPPDAFYINNGLGVFTLASWTDGRFLDTQGEPLKQPPRDLGLSVMMRDINGDRFPDIYVCNDFQTPDRIWLNDGQGRYRALADLAIRTTPHFSMAVDFADIDRDGAYDIMLSDMLSRFHQLRMTQVGATNPPSEHVGEVMDRQQARRNVLLWNRGDSTYAAIANYAGVGASDWTWVVAFLDVDLDGLEDLLITNGHAYDTQDMDAIEKVPAPRDRSRSSMRGDRNLKAYPLLLTPNYVFRNRGDRTFKEVGRAWGFHSTNVSHGLAFGDLDNDGDLDVAVNCLNQQALVYRNNAQAPRVAVRLRGKRPNTYGIGAHVVVRGGPVARQSQEIIAGGRYLSSDQPMRVFAAGSLTNRLTIEVTWRSGARSIISNALPNHLYEIDEAAAKPAAPSPPPAVVSPPIFKDVSALLNHTSQEAAFDDLERQPLLPKMLSQLGPGVAWFDLNDDGHDELIVGAGRSQSLALFRNTGQGTFTRWTGRPWDAEAADDYTGIVGWTPASDRRALLVGVAAYETTNRTAGTVWRFENSPLRPQPLLGLRGAGSLGPLATADIDGDGDLDLFIGGRLVKGRYPEPASSYIYRNQGGVLELDSVNSGLLEKIGLVSGAVFSDLNQDGLPELILACEWGPIRIFLNTAGKFRSITSELGLATYAGWWNGVTTGDIDGDGRLDIIASNWGLNSSYSTAAQEQPVRIYYGDFDSNGAMDLIEAFSDPESDRVVPRRDLAFLSSGLPLLRGRFPSHRSFSQADVKMVLGDQFAQAQQVQAGTFASMLFLNRGDQFKAVPLPPEAQYAVAFGVNVADLDGDGHEDVFLSQNYFAMRLEEPRLDAGRGLWLRGDGTGRLRPLLGHKSGVKIYGEQRGSALGDFDEDGRVDLVVAQPAGSTKLYRNEQARPGLRARLAGPPQNPLGIGAVIRLDFGPKQGPAREIHGGSGYWSQDSSVQVMATPTPPIALSIRWPGGRVTKTEIPADAKEIVADWQGKLQVIR